MGIQDPIKLIPDPEVKKHRIPVLSGSATPVDVINYRYPIM
jgi:hypothetical protein